MPKRGRAPSRVLACAQRPGSAAAARGSKEKSVGLPARHVESLAVTSPDIAETFFAFAVKAWAFEPPRNDVIWSPQLSKRGALAARQRRAAVGASAQHLRSRSRFPLSLSLSALRPARPFRRDTHTPTSQVHGPSLSAGIGPVGSVGRPTAVLGFASAFWGVLAAPRTAHRRRRWGKLTRNSRSVVVTTAIPMENLTRPCIADSRGAVFERRQPIL